MPTLPAKDTDRYLEALAASVQQACGTVRNRTFVSAWLIASVTRLSFQDARELIDALVIVANSGADPRVTRAEREEGLEG